MPSPIDNAPPSPISRTLRESLSVPSQHLTAPPTFVASPSPLDADATLPDVLPARSSSEEDAPWHPALQSARAADDTAEQEAIAALRRIRRRQREIEDEEDEREDETELFSRSVASGHEARTRRRRRLILSPDETLFEDAEANAMTIEGETASERVRRELSLRTDPPVRGSRVREMNDALTAASRTSYESPDEVEWRQRVEGVRLRRATANESFLSMTACPGPTSQVLQLFCAACRARVCCRGVESRVGHGQPPVEPRESQRRSTRLTRLFTSDAPPLPDAVGLLGPLERVTHDSAPDIAETARRWDCCACIRASTGCLSCGSHLGYFIITPCAICLRDVALGHVFLFLPDRVLVSPRCEGVPSSTCPDSALSGTEPIPKLEDHHLNWSTQKSPCKRNDYAAGLVGDPVSWLIGSSTVGADNRNSLPPIASATPTLQGSRLPYWLLKARSQLNALGSSVVRPAVTYSGALSRSPAIRVPSTSATNEEGREAMAPSRPQRMRFDLDDPDGIDAHAVLEPVGYGSLSADGAEVEVNRPLVSLFSQPGAQARWSVGR